MFNDNLMQAGRFTCFLTLTLIGLNLNYDVCVVALKAAEISASCSSAVDGYCK